VQQRVIEGKTPSGDQVSFRYRTSSPP